MNNDGKTSESDEWNGGNMASYLTCGKRMENTLLPHSDFTGLFMKTREHTSIAYTNTCFIETNSVNV